MRRFFGGFKRLARDRKGISAVELGLIAVPFCMVMVGLIDLCYQMYLYSVLQGATNDAARAVTVEAPAIGTSGTLEQRMQQQVRARLGGLAPTSATLSVAATTYNRYSDRGRPERLTDDKDGDGRYDVGDCWLDTNPNGSYDTTVSGSSGVGGADDVIEVTSTLAMNRLIPVGALWGGGNTYNMTVRAVIRRQPFQDQAPPAEVCG